MHQNRRAEPIPTSSKKMDVQSGKLTRLKAPCSGIRRKPMFPFLADFMMPDIRRISYEQGRTIDFRQRNSPVILNSHLQTIGETEYRRICSQEQGRKWINFDGHECGFREMLRRRPNVSAGTGTRIDDTHGSLTFLN